MPTSRPGTAQYADAAPTIKARTRPNTQSDGDRILFGGAVTPQLEARKEFMNRMKAFEGLKLKGNITLTL